MKVEQKEMDLYKFLRLVSYAIPLYFRLRNVVDFFFATELLDFNNKPKPPSFFLNTPSFKYSSNCLPSPRNSEIISESFWPLFLIHVLTGGRNLKKKKNKKTYYIVYFSHITDTRIPPRLLPKMVHLECKTDLHLKNTHNPPGS